MEGCDLSFERSEVEASVKGSIDSVKNPICGYIEADEIGEEIWDDFIKDKSSCTVRVRSTK